MAYEGISIVDYLKSVGKASDMTSRAKLASDYGISGYSGTADQNLKLLSLLKGAEPVAVVPNSPAPADTTNMGSFTPRRNVDREKAVVEKYGVPKTPEEKSQMAKIAYKKEEIDQMDPLEKKQLGLDMDNLIYDPKKLKEMGMKAEQIAFLKAAGESANSAAKNAFPIEGNNKSNAALRVLQDMLNTVKNVTDQPLGQSELYSKAGLPQTGTLGYAILSQSLEQRAREMDQNYQGFKKAASEGAQDLGILLDSYRFARENYDKQLDYTTKLIDYNRKMMIENADIFAGSLVSIDAAGNVKLPDPSTIEQIALDMEVDPNYLLSAINKKASEYYGMSLEQKHLQAEIDKARKELEVGNLSKYNELLTKDEIIALNKAGGHFVYGDTKGSAFGFDITGNSSTASLGDGMKRAFLLALDKARLTDADDARAVAYMNELLDAGEVELAKSELKSYITKGSFASEAKFLTAAEQATDALHEIYKGLQQLEEEGVEVDLTTGLTKDYLEKIGEAYPFNSNVNKVATKLQTAIINYRYNVSGAAFTESEAATYAALFPSIYNNIDLNKAKIDGLVSTFDEAVTSYYRQKMGHTNYDAIYGDEEKTVIPVDQKFSDYYTSFPVNSPEQLQIDNDFTKLTTGPNALTPLEAKEYLLDLAGENDETSFNPVGGDTKSASLFSRIASYVIPKAMAAEEREMREVDVIALDNNSDLAESVLGGKTIKARKTFLDDLIAADAEMRAATGKGLEINQHFRTNDQQKAIRDKFGYTDDSAASGSGGLAKAAPPGTSFHEKGLAVDVTNWKEAAPFLKKYGIVNGIPGDMGHFSRGEINKKYKKKQMSITDTPKRFQTYNLYS